MNHECNPVSTKKKKKPNPRSIYFTDDVEFVDPDLGHSFEAVEQQVFGSASFPSMFGFVEQALSISPNLSETVMKGFRPEAVPVYASLVKEFTVFDRWNLRKLKYVVKFHQFDLKFNKDARDGKLPSLTVIEPRYFDLKQLPANDDHPSHDVANGQKLVKEVYDALRASPQWNETLLFDRLRVRVPTIMVSPTPWIKKGTTLPDIVPLRTTEAKEDAALSEFQREVVRLAAVLNGDHFLSSFPDQMSKKMTVKEAHEYMRGAVPRFIRASKEAIKLGADESAIVDMRPSLTMRSSNP
ncbi:hypothetical protein V6N13_117020 [Hibiscus sabdariffa]